MADEKKEKQKLTAFVVLETQQDGKTVRAYYTANPTHFSVKSETTFNGFSNEVKSILRLTGFAKTVDKADFAGRVLEQ